jgi:hypothetical protein
VLTLVVVVAAQMLVAAEHRVAVEQLVVTAEPQRLTRVLEVVVGLLVEITVQVVLVL